MKIAPRTVHRGRKTRAEPMIPRSASTTPRDASIGPTQAKGTREIASIWTRGLSLVLLGVLMLAISRVPFAWVGPMLASLGVVLALRGIIGSALVFRPR